jgi:hypothetical protein
MRAQLGRSWWWVSLWLTSGVSVAAADPDVPGLDPARFSLRAASVHAQWLIDEGQRRSPTIRWLAGEVTRTDLIVHVVTEPLLGLAGCTVFQVRAGGYRYVTVAISTRQPRTVQLATLAHELAHVLEIADAPDVTSQAAMKALYERIGERALATGRYETEGARRVGEQALSELVVARPRPVDAGHLARLVRPGIPGGRAWRRDRS